MILRHYFYFDKTEFQIENSRRINKKIWNQLRINTKSNPFAIEDTLEQYEANCMDKHNKIYLICADLMCEFFDKFEIKKVVSLGAG